MCDRYQYRLSNNEKTDIAQNLIDILKKDVIITKQTRRFIGDWLLTGPNEKRKAFFDVWDMVLRNYLPKRRPILFRVCSRISKTGKIASFTGRLECASRFSEGRGLLLICDTNETIKFEKKLYKVGEYKHTFYPLVDVLVKAKKSGRWGFSNNIFNFIGEDEYIMRTNFDSMHAFKWM